MDIEKSKLKKRPTSHNQILFILLWIIGHLIAWSVFTAGLFIPGFLGSDGNSPHVMTIAFILGALTSTIQYLLIRWQFGRDIKWWIPISFIAWGFGIFACQAIFDMANTQFGLMMKMLALYTPATLVQILLLRKHVQQSWLWLLGTFAGASVFALSVRSLHLRGTLLAFSIGVGLYAGTKVLTLIWLFSTSKTSLQQQKLASAYKQYEDGASMASFEEDDLSETKLQIQAIASVEAHNQYVSISDRG